MNRKNRVYLIEPSKSALAGKESLPRNPFRLKRVSLLKTPRNNLLLASLSCFVILREPYRSSQHLFETEEHALDALWTSNPLIYDSRIGSNPAAAKQKL